MNYAMPAARPVLLVEDDAVLGSGLSTALRRTGLDVRWTRDVGGAREAVDAEVFAAILLDLGLPDGDGLSFLRDLRRGGDVTPVMIVTAVATRDTRLSGLNDGADDYVTKPFDLDEVIARLRALIRRAAGIAGDVVPFDAFELDLKGQVVRSGKRTITLTAREFRVLSMLVTRAGRWVSKPDLEHGVYDDAVDIESNTIESAVSALRKKLGAHIIVTARGLGYMVSK